MKTVKQVSKITGVSVRTLHHYDSIGLLKPTAVTQANYRLYDDAAIGKLQTILMFKELNFSLSDIKTIINNPDFNLETTLKQQIGLLELQRNRLNKLIHLAREIIETGVNNMNFSAFDKTEIEQYEAEAKAKWGLTEAYAEFESKAANQSDKDKQLLADTMMLIFAEIGKIKHLSAESDEAQKLIKKLQQFISDNYYTCTTQALQGLGQMYTADERFRQNIDRAGGSGTAEFTQKATEFYCRNA